MADLEETILKKNVPGRYSKWNDYNNEGIRKSYNGDEDEENDDNYDDEHNSAFEESNATNNAQRAISQSPLPSDGREGHRTGVKGVLSDYKEAKRLEKIKFENEQLKRKDAFQRATEGSWMKPGEVSISLASIQQQKRIQKQNQGEGDSKNDDSRSTTRSTSGEDDDSFFDDDENDTSFLETYRRMRLTEMQQNALPEYGQVQQLHTPTEFSDVIDQTDPRVYCIFHLFSDDIGSCRLLNQHLDKLAADKMIKCRFLKIKALVLKEDFDFIGLPCVLIYKAGDEVANLTPITEMFDSAKSMRGAFTMEEVEYVLNENCGITAK